MGVRASDGQVDRRLSVRITRPLDRCTRESPRVWSFLTAPGLRLHRTRTARTIPKARPLSATGTPTAAVPAAALHWRRSVSRLTAGQLQLLRDAFAAMK